jgi:branched-chain amino acid transport system substrate-binding protein
MMSRSLRKCTGAVLPALTVVALALAGCSSSSPSSSSSTPGTSTSSTSAQSAPIVVGVLGSFSGVASGSTADAKILAQDWVSATNAAGGINGHPVKAIILDDQNSASIALANATQLVQQDHVKAILDLSENLEPAWAKVADSAHVPVIGNSETPLFGTDPNFYPTGTTVLALTWGELVAGARAKVTKLSVLYCAEIANCAEAIPLITSLGKPLHMQLSYAAKISSTAVSYTAPCLGAKNAGTQGGTVAAASDVALRVAESCATQGYKPTWLTTGGEMTTAWLKQPAVNGAVGNSQEVPWFDDSIPATKAMQAAIAKYSPSVASSDGYGAVATIGWAAGTVFAAVAQAAHLTPSSSTSVLIAALHQVSNDTFGGITPPLTYTAGKPTSVPCSFLESIKNGNWTEPIGLKTVCLPAT